MIARFYLGTYSLIFFIDDVAYSLTDDGSVAGVHHYAGWLTRPNETLITLRRVAI